MRLDLFQKLALATTACTYVLIMVGALVRAVGAGLGCPDWPKCFGSWVPPTSADQLPPGFDASQFVPLLTWVEYLNRLVGVFTGFLILGTLWLAWRHYRHHTRVWLPALLAALLVGFQGWLGGQVVRSGLEGWMITAHLVVALVIVSLLLYATVNAFFPAGRPPEVGPGRHRLARLASAFTAFLLLQVAVGTQVRAEIEDGLEHAGDLGRGQWLELVGQVYLVHRELALASVLAALALAVWVRRRHADQPWLPRTADALLALSALQVLVGVALAYLDFPAAAQVLHVGLASLMLGAATALALLAWRLPPRGAAPAA